MDFQKSIGACHFLRNNLNFLCILCVVICNAWVVLYTTRPTTVNSHAWRRRSAQILRSVNGLSSPCSSSSSSSKVCTVAAASSAHHASRCPPSSSSSSALSPRGRRRAIEDTVVDDDDDGAFPLLRRRRPCQCLRQTKSSSARRAVDVV